MDKSIATGPFLLNPFVLSGLMVLSLLSYGIGLVLYNRFLHPLSHYPGPFLWTVSRMPFALSLQRGDLVHDTKAIHDRYGSTVRLGPNELSFIDAQAWYDIYGHQKRGHQEFPKNPIWAHPAPNGVYSLINARGDNHPRMRKPLVPAFSNKALKEQESLIQGYVDILIRQLRKHARESSSVVDMKDYYNWTTFDIIGDLAFGEPFDCLEKEQYHFWVAFLFGHLKWGALRASVNFYPWIASLLFALVPKSLLSSKAHHAHFEMSKEKVQRRIALQTDRKDFLSYILRANDEKGMTIPELEATSSVIILAGSESTSTMLTATTNFLVRNPSKLEKLVNEIRTTFTNEADITLNALEQLPYLKAVFQEGFRVAPPVPTQIPRIVPPEGAIVCGNALPGNTFVGVPQYAAYRYTSHFTYPDLYIPERWLPGDSPLYTASLSDPPFTKSTFAKDERNVVQPFSVGPRNCIGINLAYAEMRLVLARLVWNFNLQLPAQSGSFQNKTLIFEKQKTYALWEREPCYIEIALAR